MEKRTFYVHKAKEDKTQHKINNEYRVVTFIGGNKDIVNIIKELIKTKYQA